VAITLIAAARAAIEARYGNVVEAAFREPSCCISQHRSFVESCVFEGR
jgi:hypothetical protein